MTGLKNFLFLAKYSLMKPGTFRRLRQAVRNETLAAQELEELNWARTKALVAYAFEKVPYYQRKFAAAGLHPSDLKGPDTFAHVPVLTRQDVQEHFQDLVSTDARPRQLRLVTTGGSTGQPVKVYHEKRIIRDAMRWRMLAWWGLTAGDDMASVYRDSGGTFRARLIQQLLAWPGRRILLDAACVDETAMRRFLDEFARRRPPLLHGYVGAMDHLAQYMLDHSIQVPPPRAIWVTSAPLTPVQERRIEVAFGSPVYDQYGCCEVYWLAAQCPAKGGLHMFHDARRIEFLDEQNRPRPVGELGVVAVTDLDNRLFPLIRYLNGDVSRRLAGQCSCGRTLPLMDKVRGRVTDIVRLPSGKCISGDYLTTLFDDQPEAVRQFQVHQKADYAIDIVVTPNPDFPALAEALERVRRTLADRVAGEVAVGMVRVKEIPQKNGKLRFVRSEVTG